jgi:hypothetical protein
MVRLGLAISGQIWKWEAISYAAGAAGSITAGLLVDEINDWGIGGRIYDWTHIDPTTNTRFNDAQAYVIPRRDPLVLDLDGDGLELISANGTVLFDHNADGIKTGTGWAAPNDGLLVRDLNGNGTIDSGRELFGIDTIKSNNTFATQGFDALKDLDSNADGFITSADTAFSQLQVWQDLNQDGVSQTGEPGKALNKCPTMRDQPDSGGLLRWLSCQYPDIGGEIRLAAHPDPVAAHSRGPAQRFPETLSQWGITSISLNGGMKKCKVRQRSRYEKHSCLSPNSLGKKPIRC